MHCKSDRLTTGSQGTLQLFFLTFFLLFLCQEPAKAGISAEAGTSSEYLSVTSNIEGEQRSFTLIRPMGLHVGAAWGDSSSVLRPYVFGQIQVPSSLARIESLRSGMGLRYYLNTPVTSAAEDLAPVSIKTRTSTFYFLQMGLNYQKVFIAFLDKDKQPLTFSRSASGFSLGVGTELFWNLLSRESSEWRFSDDRRLRLQVVFDSCLSLLTFDVATTQLLSLTLKVTLQKPL